MLLAVVYFDLPGKRIEHMRNDIVVQRHRWLVAINAPVGIVDSVPIHSLQRCGKVGVVMVFKWVEVVSAHRRLSSANGLAASLVLHVRAPCSRVAESWIFRTEVGSTFLDAVCLSV